MVNTYADYISSRHSQQQRRRQAPFLDMELRFFHERAVVGSAVNTRGDDVLQVGKECLLARPEVIRAAFPTGKTFWNQVKDGEHINGWRLPDFHGRYKFFLGLTKFLRGVTRGSRRANSVDYALMELSALHLYGRQTNHEERGREPANIFIESLFLSISPGHRLQDLI